MIPEETLSRRRLARRFYRRPALAVARDLIGRVLVRTSGGQRASGRILETEAYGGSRDRASHSSRGRTPRTEPMFWEGGHAYVYLVYGMHLCFNVVTGEEGVAAAVLIRAIEPLEGIDQMMTRSPRSRPRDLGRGPGRLSRAVGIVRTDDRADLCQEGLHLEEGASIAARQVVRGPRIGVDYAGAWAAKPWRLGWRDHPGLSRPF